ncbi:MAG: TraX family protein, partial [Elainellaceae cyanobacterium]
LVATAISMDGGGYGVVIVLLMAHPLTLRWWAVWIVMHGLLAASEQIRLMQLWAIPAPLLVLLVAGANRAASKEYPLSKHAAGDRPSKPRPKARWFYWFYPGHLLALWLIRLVV